MNNMVRISATIAGPSDATFLINASHSLAKAPATIITNRMVEILLAFGSNDFVKF